MTNPDGSISCRVYVTKSEESTRMATYTIEPRDVADWLNEVPAQGRTKPVTADQITGEMVKAFIDAGRDDTDVKDDLWHAGVEVGRDDTNLVHIERIEITR